jgi:hypothetical protein
MRATHHTRAASRLAVALVAAAQIAAAGASASYKAPWTEYGRPDLQGVWNYSSDVPLERPKELADKASVTRDERAAQNAAREANFDRLLTATAGHDKFWLDYASQVEDLRTSLITHPVNGRLPKLVDGVQRVGGFAAAMNDVKGTRPVRFFAGGIAKDGPEDRGLFERCIVGPNTGPPFTPGGDNNYLQIVQTRDYVVLLAEHIHDARIVPLDGRPHVDASIRRWYGDSRGRGEGDTLIVETTNFSELTQSFNDSGVGTAKIVTERFTRVSNIRIDYEATIADPQTFQDAIVLSFPMVRFDGRVFEFACHENNYSMPAILSGARQAERQ